MKNLNSFKPLSIRLLSGLFSIILIAGMPAYANTIVVETFEDVIDDEDSACSLREAIIAANTDQAFSDCSAGSGADTINLQTGNYKVLNTCQGSDNEIIDDETCGDMDVTDSLTINGAGKTQTTIEVVQSVGEADVSYVPTRIFDVHPEEIFETVSCEDSCTPGLTFALNNVTLQGGDTQEGGAILVTSNSPCSYSELQTNSVLFQHNFAHGVGGAVSITGRFVATNTNFTENSAGDNGGAVYLARPELCSVENSISTSTFLRNNAHEARGGAIYNDFGTKLIVAGSNLESNWAYLAGGAIANQSAHLTLNDSTITDNGLSPQLPSVGIGIPTLYGGGIWSGTLDSIFDEAIDGSEFEFNNDLQISNSTIAGNQARYFGAGIATIDGFTEFLLSGLFANEADLPSEDIFAAITVNTNIRNSQIKNNVVVADANFGFGSNAIYVSPIIPYSGGGIFNGTFGKMILEQVTVDGNQAPLGAGISNLFDSAIVKSTISNNQALITGLFEPLKSTLSSKEDGLPDVNAHIFAGGAGIFNAGSADITNTTIVGNKTDGSGAGVMNFTSLAYIVFDFLLHNFPSPEPTPINDDIIDPELDIPDIGTAGTRLNNTTIASNEIVALDQDLLPPTNNQVDDTEVALNNGGGIMTVLGKITIGNSAIALNQDTQPIVELPEGDFNDDVVGQISNGSAQLGDFAPDCYLLPVDDSFCAVDIFDDICESARPQIISAQHNLIGTNQGCSAFQATANDSFDIVGSEESPINPLLGALADNGGATLTRSPLKGSPLIDHGSTGILSEVSATATTDLACTPQDQRGTARNTDGDLNGLAQCDIGALEAVVDCTATPGGIAVLDSCGVCGGNGLSCIPTPAPSPIVCTEQDISATLFAMDGSGNRLHSLTRYLAKVERENGGNQKQYISNITRSNDFKITAWKTTWSIPNIVKSNCQGAQVSVKCVNVSNQSSIDGFSVAVTSIHKINSDLITKLAKRKVFKKSKIKSLRKQNDKLLLGTLSALAGVPTASSNCS